MSLALTTLALATLLTPTAVWGFNDWSVPCTSGTCSYDGGDGVNDAYSSMVINGGDTAIGDITPAAGWMLMGCNPNWSQGSHQFRMACTGSGNQTANCAHLYQDGPENTVVRLPQNCGKGPFARVVNVSVSDDQSLTGNVRKRAEGEMGKVQSLTLDYNFPAIPASRGKVSFAITANNLKAPQPLNARTLRTYRRGRDKRFDFNPINIFESLTSEVVSVATSVAGVVTSDAASVVSVVTSAAVSVASVVTSDAVSIASVVTSAAGAAASDVASLANGVNKTFDLGTISFDKDITLLDANIQCDTAKASGTGTLHIDVDTKVDAKASFNLDIKGAFSSLPKLDLFTLTGSVSGDASATFNLDADLQGTFTTGRIQLFQKALSPFSIPGIITLGPQLTIDGDLDMNIDMQAQLALTADWSFPQAQFTIPKGQGPSAGDATTQKTDNPLTLKADPSIDITGTVTAHVIPRLDFGIDIAEGIAKATLFMDVDLAGVVDMDVSSQALSTAGVDSTSSSNDTSTDDGSSSDGTTTDDGTADPTTTDDGTSDSTTTTNSTSAKGAPKKPVAAGATASASQPKATSAPAKNRKHARAFGRNPSALFGRRDSTADSAVAAPDTADNSTALDPGVSTQANSGCIQMSGSIVMNIGAEGAILPFFDDTIQDTIFTKSFPNIFTKCFGGATPTTQQKRAVKVKAPAKAPTKPTTGKSGSSSAKPGDTSSLLCGASTSLGGLIGLPL